MFPVLVVEDELLIRDAIVETVNRFVGYEVVGEASNGEEGWQIIQEQWPLIVITDIRTPIVDGIELVKRVRQDELPIVTIIVSGYGNFQYAQQAIHLGVSEYLLKPISEQELHTALERSVKRVTDFLKPNRILTQMQNYLDHMHDTEPSELLDQGMAVVDSILHYYRAQVGPRTSFLRIFLGRLVERVKAIYPEYCEGAHEDLADDHAVRLRFRDVIHDWIRHYPEYANNNMRMVIKRACDEIWNSYAEELTSKQMAGKCNLSLSYFGVLFKQYTNQTFINYVNKVRIEKAKELLRTTDMKIYEVSEAVGYQSLPYFNRVFKQVAELTPNEYRKMLGI